MSPFAKSILWRCILGSITFIFSGIFTILGLNPSAKIVAYLFGEERIKIIGALFMNIQIAPDVLRWDFVILGDGFWLITILLFIGIPILKQNAKIAQLKFDLKESETRQCGHSRGNGIKLSVKEVLCIL
jgi:hypothetical protein